MNRCIWSLILPDNWCFIEQSSFPTEIDSWLRERASMTQRFECYCCEVSVQVVFEGFVDKTCLFGEEALLPESKRYWLRDVLLCGDAIPWLQARTILPEATLTGAESRLKTLGSTPLGRYLFSGVALSRDFIQVQQCEQLWVRRSRLRLSGKPLLLTELFLPASPIYK